MGEASDRRGGIGVLIAAGDRIALADERPGAILTRRLPPDWPPTAFARYIPAFGERLREALREGRI